MRHFIVVTTGVFLIAASGQAMAGHFSPAGFSRAECAPVILVQALKDVTLKL